MTSGRWHCPCPHGRGAGPGPGQVSSGRIVYVALSRDERTMGFGFPKDERAALVAAQPEKFSMPIPSDMRYNWVQVRLDAIDEAEMRELVIDAWTMVVPKRVAAEYLGDDHP